jgi:predicted transcriptional regulator YheO
MDKIQDTFGPEHYCTSCQRNHRAEKWNTAASAGRRRTIYRCESSTVATDADLVGDIVIALKKEGLKLSRDAIRQILKTIQSNKVVLDFLGRR